MNNLKTENKAQGKELGKKFGKWFLHKLPVILIALLILFAGWKIAHTVTPQEEQEAIAPYAYDGGEDPVIVENDELKLTMDPLTTQFALEVKDTGKVWYSNPQDVAEDPIALPDEIALLQSPLVMSYSVTQGLETTYNSYAYSTQNGIYEIVPGDKEIRVNYSLGNVEKEYVVPPVMIESDFKEWMGKMDKKDADLVGQYYKKYDIHKLSPKDSEEELLASYPCMADNITFVLRPSTKENVKKQIQDLFAGVGFTYDDYLASKELDLAEKINENPVFNVSVIYKLEGKDLVVEVPLQDLQYDKETPIYTITPLPYFGAGNGDTDGYMVVPEGGGATIHFNNGKVSQSSYYTNLYGWDMCISREAVVHNTRAYFGAYGIAEGEDSFVCMLEDGSSYASIQADIAGKKNNYNYVNSIYSICQREKYDVGDIANSEIYEYVDTLPDEILKQRYTFVDSGDYVDMAKCYGSYLDKKYPNELTPVQDASTPVAVEIIGSIDKVKQICGVPVSRPLKLTSFAEASGIVQDLSDNGVSNMHVKLSGWCNGGVNQKILKKAKPVRDLGSKKDLQKLAQTAESTGSTLYLNGITQYAFDSNITNGFFSFRDAAKKLSKERALLHVYSHVTYGERENSDNAYYLLHTGLAEKLEDELVKTAGKYQAGASFQDLGKDLSSDFYKKAPYSRQAVLNKQTAKLAEFADKTPVMINMGNDYAVPFATMVTDVDLRGSEYTILDECIPFFQLAVHGKVDYTGDSLNICGNPEQELLASAQYGAGLQFTFMKESSFITQKTLYSQYYGANYDSWKDKALEIYNRYNAELGHTFNQEMTDYENLSGTVSKTEYADGTKVYVNFGYQDFTTEDGVKVPARDYTVTR